MPGLSRVGVDKCAGIIIGALQSTVFCNKSIVSVKGDPVTPHGPGPHAGPKTNKSSSTVKAGGIPVVRAGDNATCGHPATGSGNVNAG